MLTNFCLLMTVPIKLAPYCLVLVVGILIWDKYKK